MVTITFATHATSRDNINRVASGHFDAELSELGVRQARELGARHAPDDFAAIFCSDLQRSYMTAALAFGARFPIVKDARLRECNFGDFTRRPSAEVDREKVHRITTPFPHGESYEQAVHRVGDFLADLVRDFNGTRVMVVGHRATQYGLEHWIRGVSVAEAVLMPWEWQPGWMYALEDQGR